jgi:hypothetical protein
VLQGDFEAIVTWPWMHEEHGRCVSCPGCRCCYYVPKHGFLGLQETLRVAELPLKPSEFSPVQRIGSSKWRTPFPYRFNYVRHRSVLKDAL